MSDRPDQPRSGWRRSLGSFRFALAGVGYLWKTQVNFRVQCAAAAIAIGLGAVLGITRLEWVAIVGCIGLVLGLEAVNSAIEAAIDLASPEIHPLAKAAKDCGAAGVLLAAVAAAVIGAVIFLPRIVGFFG